MQLPTTISLSDTETLKALAAHGILISDLIASGEYRWGGATEQPKETQAAKTTVKKQAETKQRNLL